MENDNRNTDEYRLNEKLVEFGRYRKRDYRIFKND